MKVGNLLTVPNERPVCSIEKKSNQSPPSSSVNSHQLKRCNSGGENEYSHLEIENEFKLSG